MNTSQPLAQGDLILVYFPFSDLTGRKLRPALIAGRVNGDELTLAFVTSQVSSVDARTDVIVDATDPEFQFTGLKTTSSIRLSKLATVHRRLVQRRLGTIGPVTKREVSGRLRYIFGL